MAAVSFLCCLGAATVWVQQQGTPVRDPEPVFTDTEGWVGAEYTPAATSNELWWWEFEKYEADIHRELEAASRHLGFTALRMFLHSMLFEADSAKLLNNMDKFLSIAGQYGMRCGFVFFDDCWNPAGANLSAPCLPRQGRHNGCWMQSPQADARGDVQRYQPYLQEVVGRFQDDPRVLFWEVYNEPRLIDSYSVALRAAAYGWAKEVNPTQPVISCWNDNEVTDLIDVHFYNDAPEGWQSMIYSHAGKGAVVTEAGARQYSVYSSLGSPLEWVQYLQWLKYHAQPPPPFVPGVFIDWELMVGNSNTRWSWTAQAGDPEPTIPYHGHLFPDGTPVSFTESAAIRNYTSGRDDFLVLDTFNPLGLSRNTMLRLIAPESYRLVVARPSTSFVVEALVWMESVDAVVELTLQSSPAGYFRATLDVAAQQLRLESHSAPQVLRTQGGGQIQWGDEMVVVDATQLSCGLSKEQWNLLRVQVQDNTAAAWLNNMWPDAVDPLTQEVHDIAPRAVVQAQDLQPADVHTFTCVRGYAALDYISAVTCETGLCAALPSSRLPVV